MTSFTDVSAFASIPRLTSLRLSPDGSWLAVGVPDRGRRATQVRHQHLAGRRRGADRAPVRLTRGAEGEGSPRFLPDGSLVFAARRPAATGRPGGGPPPPDKPALWLLPALGGEARRIAAPPGGVRPWRRPPNAPVLACLAAVLPGAATASDDAARARRARTPGSARSCTRAAASGTGTTTSARPPRRAGSRPERRRPGGPARAARPDPGRGPGARRAGVRADAGRVGRGHELDQSRTAGRRLGTGGLVAHRRRPSRAAAGS